MYAVTGLTSMPNDWRYCLNANWFIACSATTSLRRLDECDQCFCRFVVIWGVFWQKCLLVANWCLVDLFFDFLFNFPPRFPFENVTPTRDPNSVTVKSSSVIIKRTHDFGFPHLVSPWHRPINVDHHIVSIIEYAFVILTARHHKYYLGIIIFGSTFSFALTNQSQLFPKICLFFERNQTQLFW